MRINSARDDAAGMAISERMTTQVRGFQQAMRNSNDAISMLQVAEGGLGQISNLLQRGRELAIQAANATNSPSDRSSLQAEVKQIIDEIDRIGSTTSFNNVMILGGGKGGDPVFTGGPDEHATAKLDIIDALKRSWLKQGESMLETYFGIRGDGASLDIKFVENENYLAAVSVTGYEIATGKMVGLTLNIDLSDFSPANWPNGGPSSISNERIIAHELTHAVMARTTNMQALPLWFIEGAAEFIHGADDRLYGDITTSIGATTSAKVESLMNSYLNNNGSVQQYSAGYAALRYMHQEIIDNGGEGIREVFDYLRTTPLSTLDDALGHVSSQHAGMTFNDTASLAAAFADGQEGNTYITSLYDGGSLQNLDTGAVGGPDAQAGGLRNTSATGVIPDTGPYSDNPLQAFNVKFPMIDTTSIAKLTLNIAASLNFHVGANANQTITVDLSSVQASTLNLLSVNIALDAQAAIGYFDSALQAIDQERARLGASQNRMEYVVASLSTMHENISASRSRIVDADYAAEVGQLTRSQILHQAGTAVLAQANTQPRLALKLLETG